MNDLSRLTIDRSRKERRQRSWWRHPGALAALALVVVLAGYYVIGGPGHVVDVETGKVVRAWPAQSLTRFNATGYVVPRTKADVASKATGRIESIEVDAGSDVAKGQILARLENADVVAAMHRAEADVTAAQAAIAEARARHAEALARVVEGEAALREAERALARAVTLIERKFVSDEFHDAAISRRDRAQAALASARAASGATHAAIDADTARLAAARAALDEARVTVENTVIRAPFDGVVLAKHADVGDVMAPFAATTQSKGAVVTMADLDTLEVEADISESSLSGVTAGQPAEIQLDALPEVRLRGEVERIVPTVDRAKATVLAKVRFIDRDPRVLPDMSARVAFLERPLDPSERQARTLVPSAGVVTRAGHTLVYRIGGGAVLEVPVVTGATFGEMTEILEGVAPGDEVVIGPDARLRDGVKVRVADDTP